MAKIIGKKPVAVKRTVCRDGCGYKIEYVPNDVQEYHGRDYGGGPDGHKYIRCPNCSKKIILESW